MLVYLGQSGLLQAIRLRVREEWFSKANSEKEYKLESPPDSPQKTNVLKNAENVRSLILPITITYLV